MEELSGDNRATLTRRTILVITAILSLCLIGCLVAGLWYWSSSNPVESPAGVDQPSVSPVQTLSLSSSHPQVITSKPSIPRRILISVSVAAPALLIVVLLVVIIWWYQYGHPLAPSSKNPDTPIIVEPPVVVKNDDNFQGKWWFWAGIGTAVALIVIPICVSLHNRHRAAHLEQSRRDARASLLAGFQQLSQAATKERLQLFREQNQHMVSMTSEYDFTNPTGPNFKLYGLADECSLYQVMLISAIRNGGRFIPFIAVSNDWSTVLQPNDKPTLIDHFITKEFIEGSVDLHPSLVQPAIQMLQRMTEQVTQMAPVEANPNVRLAQSFADLEQVCRFLPLDYYLSRPRMEITCHTLEGGQPFSLYAQREDDNMLNTYNITLAVKLQDSTAPFDPFIIVDANYTMAQMDQPVMTDGRCPWFIVSRNSSSNIGTILNESQIDKLASDITRLAECFGSLRSNQ